MKTNLQEISKLIQDKLKHHNTTSSEEEYGIVLETGDGIAKVAGLNNVMLNELIQFENGSMGLAMNLEYDCVGTIIFGDAHGIKEGEQVFRTKKLLSIPAGPEFIGRIINPLGEPLDGLPAPKEKKRQTMDIMAPGITKRQPVTEPLHTGIKAIDSMIPIGRGQRELIIGDRNTGKTSLALDTIINQRNSGVISIYVAIGQKASSIVQVIEKLKEYDAMKNTIMVVATASDPAPFLYMAPYAGCALAEYFMYEEKAHTLCVYDDLTKQANAYRQISLLLNRPPGREAYPGDVFYLHSRLLERSAKLSDKWGGGSLTALPIIETQEGEVSAYIPTNVISITDGQIYLTPSLFSSGIRPAIDVGISVSRVGGSAQLPLMKKVAGRLRLDMAQFRNLESFSQISTGMDNTTKQQLNSGYRLVEILKQKQYKPMSPEEQIIMLHIGTSEMLNEIPVNKIELFEKEFLNHARSQLSLKDILKEKDLTKSTFWNEAIEKFIQQFKTTHQLNAKV